MFLTPNEQEGLEAAGSRDTSDRGLASACESLAVRTDSVVCMTLGSKGCLIYEDGEISRVDAYNYTGEKDTCGAGDSFFAAFSTAKTAGADTATAARFANLAANVTIRKIGQTGSAAPVELLDCLKKLNGDSK